MKSFDVKNDIFTSVHSFTSYSEYPFEWIQPSNGEVWDMTHSDYYQHVLRESELRSIGEPAKQEYEIPSDSILFYGTNRRVFTFPKVTMMHNDGTSLFLNR